MTLEDISVAAGTKLEMGCLGGRTGESEISDFFTEVCKQKEITKNTCVCSYNGIKTQVTQIVKKLI